MKTNRKKFEKRGTFPAAFLVFLLTTAIILTACNKIDYTQIDGQSVTESETDDPAATAPPKINEHKTTPFDISDISYTHTTEVETDTNTHTVLTGYSGSGYGGFKADQNFTIREEIPYSGHYDIRVYAHTNNGGVAELVCGDVSYGAFYFTPERQVVSETENGGTTAVTDFTPYEMLVYVEKGTRDFEYRCLSGDAEVDKVEVVRANANAGISYKVNKALSASAPTDEALALYQYITDIYGKKTLTGQRVTAGGNAEITAVRAATGREPAIRGSDAADFIGDNTLAKSDIELAKKWWDNKGIVAYTWLWKAPQSNDCLAANTNINLDTVLAGITPAISVANADELDEFVSEGVIAADARDLILDIDKISSFLLELKENKVPVLWEPLPQGGTQLFWWGGTPEHYVTLYTLMYRRMAEYNGVDNLIWVWGGESADFYPGNIYVDVIGGSVFKPNNHDSDRVLFDFLSYFSDARTKHSAVHPAAVTALGIAPDPDLMMRDNDMWVWFEVERGGYVINGDGTLAEKYNTKEILDKAYNHELTIARDELPVFSTYGAS